MIRELFFPRTVGGKLLFSEKSIGIAVDDLSIHVVHMYTSRHKVTIKHAEEFAINDGDPKTYYQRLSTGLKKVAAKLPKNVPVRVNFPSSKVVLKELSVPFLDAEKIRKVVEYEIEPSIPFALEEALVDFIIVDKSDVKEASTILAAAAQLADVKKHIETFQKVGIEPAMLTVDIFGLADLFTHTPPYSQTKTGAAIIDVGAQTTRIAVIDKQKLVATRTIDKGAVGADQEGHLAGLFEEIAFTLNSFEVKRAEALSIEKLFFVGDQDTFTQLSEFTTSTLSIPCEHISAETILKAPGIVNKASAPNGGWAPYVRALSIALVSPQFSDFTLRQKEMAFPEKPIIQRYLLTTTALFALVVGGLGISGYLDIRDMNNRITELQKKEVQRLRKVFPAGHSARKRSNVKQLVKAAEEHVQEQEEIWAPFSKQRLRPTEILQELCMLFNRKKFDVTIEEVSISGEEQETHPIEVTGLFRSKTGSEHFKHFGALEQDIKSSTILTLTEEIDPTLVEGGVQFVVRLKRRED